jgi:hypothetical protein
VNRVAKQNLIQFAILFATLAGTFQGNSRISIRSHTSLGHPPQQVNRFVPGRHAVM